MKLSRLPHHKLITNLRRQLLDGRAIVSLLTPRSIEQHSIGSFGLGCHSADEKWRHFLLLIFTKSLDASRMRRLLMQALKTEEFAEPVTVMICHEHLMGGGEISISEVLTCFTAQTSHINQIGAITIGSLRRSDNLRIRK
jgi:hypothetical protein